METLRAHPQNPRKISETQLKQLEKSLIEFGDLSGIVFNQKSGNTIGGHQRLKIIPSQVNILKRYETATPKGTIAEGFIEFEGERYAYREVEWGPEKEKAAMIAANQHGGDWSYPELAEMLVELDSFNLDMDLVGFDSKEMEEILAYAPQDKYGDKDADAVPESRATSIVIGDLFSLGQHRLLCGDSTDRFQVERLMNGERADMVYTDPPYGVSYTDKNEYLNSLGEGHRLTKAIQNDHLEIPEMKKLWDGFLATSAEACHDKASYYISSPQGGELMMMMMAIDESPWQLKHTIIWVKNNHVLGRCDYNYKHEPILYGWKKKGTHEFIGNGRCKTSVWDFNKPLKNDLHPTMKPVELIEETMANSCKREGLVFDCFLGSGSTLIAAEKSSRRCFGLEIDPQYCQVIIDRWEKFTGQKAVKIEGSSEKQGNNSGV